MSTTTIPADIESGAAATMDTIKQAAVKLQQTAVSGMMMMMMMMVMVMMMMIMMMITMVVVVVVMIMMMMMMRW